MWTINKILKRIGLRIIRLKNSVHPTDTINGVATTDLALVTYLLLQGAVIKQVGNRGNRWKITLDNVNTYHYALYENNQGCVVPKSFMEARRKLKINLAKKVYSKLVS